MQQLSTELSTQRTQQLFQFYSPSNQFAIVEQGDRAFVGNSPTLVSLKDELSYSNLKAWIAAQVMDLDNEADVKDKMGGDKAAKMADKIYSVAFYLKASELMVFFWKFKCGDYGEFYGVVDSLKIMKSLQEFIKWRNEKLASIERKAKREAEKTNPEAVAIAEWVDEWHCRLKQEANLTRSIREWKNMSRKEHEELEWLFNM